MLEVVECCSRNKSKAKTKADRHTKPHQFQSSSEILPHSDLWMGPEWVLFSVYPTHTPTHQPGHRAIHPPIRPPRFNLFWFGIQPNPNPAYGRTRVWHCKPSLFSFFNSQDFPICYFLSTKYFHFGRLPIWSSSCFGMVLDQICRGKNW